MLNISRQGGGGGSNYHGGPASIELKKLSVKMCRRFISPLC